MNIHIKNLTGTFNISWLSFLLLFFSIQTNVFATGQVMVTPTRVVFEGKMRTAQVTLLNTGSESGTFRATMVRRKMSENGEFLEVAEDEAGMYSDTLIRYSPRQVFLPPGQAQVIRMMLRKPGDLKEGEYRSHLLVQALPDPKKTNVETLVKEKTEGITVEIRSMVGITIPVIVRHGNVTSDMEFKDIKILPPSKERNEFRISINMVRNGTSSIYGDFNVTFTPDNEDKIVVAKSNGVAVYSPNKNRIYKMPLKKPAGIDFKNGEFHITYMEHGKKSALDLIAEASLVVK